jgi:hypothetical protein
MIGRKSVLGLALISVLAICAIGAQGASAAWETAKHTTAFTCVKGGGSLDFAKGDSHCSGAQVTPGTGEYGHVTIASGTKTTVETSNETTGGAREPSILTGSLFGVAVKITCNKTENGPNESYLENVLTGTDHDVVGTVSVNFRECTVTGNGATCKVKEPVVTNSFVKAQEEPTTKNMALLFSPDPEGGAYATIGFEGGCVVFSTEVKGQARGTAEGATLNFKAEDEELTAFGSKATFTGKFTTKMSGGGNPISLTTVTCTKLPTSCT